MADAHLPSFKDGIGTDLVILEVGPDKDRFVVHKDLLTSASPYFRAAFEGHFKEAKEKALYLGDDVKPRHLQTFLDWLYFRSLGARGGRWTIGGLSCVYCKGGCSLPGPDAGTLGIPILTSEDDAHLQDLIDRYRCLDILYAFADRFDVPELRQTIVNERWRSFRSGKHRISYLTVIRTFRDLPSTSPMCILVNDCFTERFASRIYEICPTAQKLRSKLPAEVLLSALERRPLLEDPYSPATSLKPLCAYHEHAQDAATIENCRKERKTANALKRKRYPDDDELEWSNTGSDESN